MVRLSFHPKLTILFYLFQNSFSVATSFSHEPLLAWAGVLWCIRTSKKLDGLKSMRWCGLISFQSPKGRVNSAHKISGFLFFFCSWLSVLRALVPWMALAVMFQGQGGGWSVMYFSLLFFVFFFWYWVFLSIVWYSQGTGVCLFSLFSLLDLSVLRDRFLWVGVQWWLDVCSSHCLLNTIITLIASNSAE